MVGLLQARSSTTNTCFKFLPNLTIGKFLQSRIPMVTMAIKILNYKHVLQNFNIDDFNSKHPDCTWGSSAFICNPATHPMTVEAHNTSIWILMLKPNDQPINIDRNIINNSYQRYALAKGTKYREPKSKLLSSILSAVKTGFRVTVTLAIPGVVWIRCGFWKFLKIC